MNEADFELLRKTYLQVLGRITIQIDALESLQVNLDADREWAAELHRELMKRQNKA